MLSDYYDYAQAGWYFALQFGDDYYTYIIGASMIVGGLLYAVLTRKGTKTMTRGEYVLTKRQQKQLEKTLVADMVTDGLLRLYTKGKLDRDRYQYWHLRFGTQLALKELLPAKLNPEQIKVAARTRIRTGFYKPVPFFKQQEVKKKPKNKLDEILNGTI